MLAAFVYAEIAYNLHGLKLIFGLAKSIVASMENRGAFRGSCSMVFFYTLLLTTP